MRPDLERLLKSVSRAFYLTLRAVPAGPREPIAVAYLLARAADTLADTRYLSPEARLEALLLFKRRVQGGREPLPSWELGEEGGTAGERELLGRLEECLGLLQGLAPADRADVRDIVDTLIAGMELDLAQFPGKLTSAEELDRHTYLAAGCVGEFWTRVCVRHVAALRSWDVPLMLERGVRFGKALQLTNVLRDVPKDLENGRSYVPGSGEGRDREVRDHWLGVALDHYRAAEAYALAVPVRCLQLRLAVLWPILIGLATLRLLVERPGFATVKVTRRGIYRILALSLLAAPFNALLRRWIDGEIARIEAQLI